MLTDAQCKNAACSPGKPRARLADSGGLYLEVSPAGSKRWFLKYRNAGKEYRLALGSYPTVGLTAARRARDAVKLHHIRFEFLHVLRTRMLCCYLLTTCRNFSTRLGTPFLGARSVLTLESGLLEGLLGRLLQHRLDVVLANEPVPADPDRPLHCRFLGSQAISLVGPASVWKGRTLRVPEDLDGVDVVLPGPRHALRAQFDALCLSASVTPRLRAEVDDMAMLRLVARDSGWLTVLPEVVVQDELRSQSLVKVGQSTQLQEHFYAITTPHRHRMERLERLLAGVPNLAAHS